MASDDKKAKTDTPPKAASAAKDSAAKVKSPAAEEPSKSKADEPAAAAPANYSRGEGQKPVTAAYKENWNAIFGKKTRKKKKR
jgi:hypothetical protein